MEARRRRRKNTFWDRKRWEFMGFPTVFRLWVLRIILGALDLTRFIGRCGSQFAEMLLGRNSRFWKYDVISVMLLLFRRGDEFELKPRSKTYLSRKNGTRFQKITTWWKQLTRFQIVPWDKKRKFGAKRRNFFSIGKLFYKGNLQENRRAAPTIFDQFTRRNNYQISKLGWK